MARKRKIIVEKEKVTCYLRAVPTLLAVMPASAPVGILIPARRHFPALCPAGVCIFSRRFHAGPREIPATSWYPGSHGCLLRLHVPAKLYPGRCCLGRARPALAPVKPFPGSAVLSRPRRDVPSAPCCLGRARPALSSWPLRPPRPSRHQRRFAQAGIHAPGCCRHRSARCPGLVRPGVVAYPGQLALPVMLLSCSRCSQQCRLLRNSAPSRRSVQPLCFSQLSCQREK
jgi:hypothetical protein